MFAICQECDHQYEVTKENRKRNVCDTCFEEEQKNLNSLSNSSEQDKSNQANNFFNTRQVLSTEAEKKSVTPYMQEPVPVFLCESELPIDDESAEGIKKYWDETVKGTMLENARLLISDPVLKFTPLLPSNFKYQTLDDFLRKQNLNDFADWLKDQIVLEQPESNKNENLSETKESVQE